MRLPWLPLYARELEDRLVRVLSLVYVTTSHAKTTTDATLAITAETLVSMDPASGNPVGELPVTPVDHIPQVVRDARIAQRSWGAMTLEQRAEILKSAVPRLAEEATQIGELLTREMGKPRPQGVGEATYCANGIAEEVDAIVDALRPETLEDERLRTTMRFDPHGVVAAITPWNFPLLMVFQSVVPALVAGNTVILKPSEETPLVAREWVAVLNEALPPNVLQLVIGDERQGKALVEAPIDLVVFIRGRGEGRRIETIAEVDGLDATADYRLVELSPARLQAPGGPALGPRRSRSRLPHRSRRVAASISLEASRRRNRRLRHRRRSRQAVASRSLAAAASLRRSLPKRRRRHLRRDRGRLKPARWSSAAPRRNRRRLLRGFNFLRFYQHGGRERAQVA